MTARPPFLLDKPSVGRLLAIGPGGRLGHMKSRALLVLAALLAAPAWSQEFDLHSESITKIVRNVAESQSVAVQLSEEKPVARDPFADDKPSHWLMRLTDGKYALFSKVGTRWALVEGKRDDVLANVGDRHFEAAVRASAE